MSVLRCHRQVTFPFCASHDGLVAGFREIWIAQHLCSLYAIAMRVSELHVVVAMTATLRDGNDVIYMKIAGINQLSTNSADTFVAPINRLVVYGFNKHIRDPSTTNSTGPTTISTNLLRMISLPCSYTLSMQTDQLRIGIDALSLSSVSSFTIRAIPLLCLLELHMTTALIALFAHFSTT